MEEVMSALVMLQGAQSEGILLKEFPLPDILSQGAGSRLHCGMGTVAA